MSLLDFTSPHHQSTMPGRSSNGYLPGNGSGIINNSGVGPIGGPGPVGSMSSLVSGNHNSFNGANNFNILNRTDLPYLSVAMLNFYLNQCKIQMDALKKALNSHSKDSPHYSCLQCRVKGE